MNDFPAFPATRVSLAFGLIYRIVTVLALGIRACGLGTMAAMTLQTVPASRGLSRVCSLGRAISSGFQRVSWGDAVAIRATRSHVRAAGWRPAPCVTRCGALNAIVAPNIRLDGGLRMAARDAFVAPMASLALPTLIGASSHAT